MYVTLESPYGGMKREPEGGGPLVKVPGGALGRVKEQEGEMWRVDFMGFGVFLVPGHWLRPRE
jgi:hypothetical protein